VGKAIGSRECAPDDKLRVPTIVLFDMVGTAWRTPLLSLRSAHRRV